MSVAVQHLEGLLQHLDEAAQQHRQAARTQTAEVSSALIAKCAQAEAARATLEASSAAAERRADAAEAAAREAMRELAAVRARCEAAEARVRALEQQRPQQQPAVQSRVAAGRPSAPDEPSAPLGARHLEVRNMPREMDAWQVRVLLEYFGAIVSLEVVPDPTPQSGALVARVSFADHAAGAAASERLHGMELKARRLEVRAVEPSPDSECAL
ncbi:hypothetical protein KFE25_005458 [Diacronema lutheri]|uniref:RRM domain-containing protein n=1 Tax=Diacronema lutheri TaxID=2081491 RepID=A0A8J5XF44_DIALT|nr:hypothetical protein KFE25_005458 [Diacronema lutheri]